MNNIKFIEYNTSTFTYNKDICLSRAIHLPQTRSQMENK